jgi:hypothetical protein
VQTCGVQGERTGRLIGRHERSPAWVGVREEDRIVAVRPNATA